MMKLLITLFAIKFGMFWTVQAASHSTLLQSSYFSCVMMSSVAGVKLKPCASFPKIDSIIMFFAKTVMKLSVNGSASRIQTYTRVYNFLSYRNIILMRGLISLGG